MQFRNFTKRLAPWLTAYLLLVSIGLPLQRVYCACVGEQWLTVLPEDRHECHHEASDQEEVHHHALNDCCVKDKTPAGDSCKSHDCGEAEVLIAQLDVDFTAETTAFELSLTAILPPTVTVVWVTQPESVTTMPLRGPPPPPPLAGRQLLVAHQTFLI